MLQRETPVVMNEDVADRSASHDEPDAEPQPGVAPAEPEAEDGPDDGSDRIPENVPDDWLDPKPFDPAGR